MKRLVLAGLLLAPATLRAQQLSPVEQRVRASITARMPDEIGYLQRLVDIPSQTLDTAGVHRVALVYETALDSLGFSTQWIPLPAAMHRAGHLVATHAGRPGGARLLLIGHFDTVVDPGGPSWQAPAGGDSMAAGVGSSDMKAGDVIILYALKALAAAGALTDLNVTVIMTGDEESVGEPLDTARAALLEAGRNADVALAFEGGNRADATVARRGASGWVLRATGRQAHSAGVFGRGAGYGAIYELARILDAFRTQLGGQDYLTFNAATVLGGTDVAYDTNALTGTAASKSNIVPRAAVAQGDIRFISAGQLAATRQRMREITAQHLPGTDARISFMDDYPAMSPTAGNARLLAAYDSASRALGYGPVAALDPGRRGAGDISFVAPLIDGLDGLGALGSGAHAPGERVNLAALPMQTERAALLFLRVGRTPASSWRRAAATN